MFLYSIRRVNICLSLCTRSKGLATKVNLSTSDLIEVVNIKAKRNRYLKAKHKNCEEGTQIDITRKFINEEKEVSVFGSLSTSKPRFPIHKSLVFRVNQSGDGKSVINDLLQEEFEDDPSDCLRLAKSGRRHDPSHYASELSRCCKVGDASTALKIFFDRMLSDDRVMPSRFHIHLLLDSLMKVGDSENAFRVYKKMNELGIQATQATYSRLFRICAEDIAVWYRTNKNLLPPVVGKHLRSTPLLNRKRNALQMALAPDIQPSDFGGPAVNRVHYLWRRLRTEGTPLTRITYNSLILALARAGDVNGCLLALNLMTNYSGLSNNKRPSVLMPDNFTLTAMLSAIEPANAKRQLVHCHNKIKRQNNQTSDLNDLPSVSNPFEFSLILWHNLLPALNYSPCAHQFTLMTNIMFSSVNGDSVKPIIIPKPFDSSNRFEGLLSLLGQSEGSISKSTRKQLIVQDNGIPTHPSATSSELATLLLKDAASRPRVLHQALCDESFANFTDSELIQVNWTDTTIALRSPINLLLPMKQSIRVEPPSEGRWLPWHRLALIGGLHGLLDVIVNYYKITPGLPLFTSLIQLLPDPLPNRCTTVDDDFDIWEKELFATLNKQAKKQADIAIYNALINRRVSKGQSANHLLADAVRNGLTIDQITWGSLARSCKTVNSVRKLLTAYRNVSKSQVNLSPEALVSYDNQPAHISDIRPSKAFFASLLSFSGFDWDMKSYIIKMMLSGDKTHNVFDLDKNEVNTRNFDGICVDKRMLATIDIDIALFRQLIKKNIIPKDGTPVSREVTGGVYVPKNALDSFEHFLTIYKHWLQHTRVTS